MTTAKNKAAETAANETVPTFEVGLTRLDEIIRALEEDHVPLDELMKLYEEGIGLLRICNEHLDTAEQKVKILKISPDGKTAHLEPFVTEDEI